MPTHAEAMKRKSESLEELRKSFKEASIAVVTDTRGDAAGMSVKQMTELRKRLREHKGELRVVKNTLALKVAKECGIEGLEGPLAGPTAIAFGYGDPAAIAKTILDYSKETKPLNLPKVKGAVLENKVFDAKRVEAIASLPSREVVLAQLLSLIITPHRQLLGMINAPGRSMATVIDAWRRKQEENS